MQSTTHGDVERWLNDLELLRTTHACAGPKFVKPFQLATLAHMLRQQNPGSLTLPEKIAPYADTMNLWGALGIQSPFTVKNRSAPGRYHPITLLQDERTIDVTANDLAVLFKSVCGNARTIDGVQTMMRELIGNCYAHSEAKDGVYGVICAQVWNGGRKAQICLADTGIGIRGSLGQNDSLADRLRAENCCALATEYGVTSKPGKGHQGYGLAVARGLLEQNRGLLYVRSGYEGFCLSAGVGRNFAAPLQWNGTLLVIEWNLDEPMDIGQVYRGFPLPEGMSDDDFDF
jgi:anti-sigma regulatory factor (Ser/Thr protein kinase)